MIRSLAAAALAALLALSPGRLAAQDTPARDADPAPDRTRIGVVVGDVPRVHGIRLNFRDRNLEEVVGANVTIWTPHESTGVVRGLALGLPATGARRIEGVTLALLGTGAEESIHGIAVAGLGVGAGHDLRGVGVSLLGAGAGRDVSGIALGGLGVGAGGTLTGIALGGLGVGAGGGVNGIAAGLLGVGAGESSTGILVGGLGAGVGGDLRGIALGGLGTGVGGDLRGIAAGGLGLGVGGTLQGFGGSLLAVGAGAIEGIAVAPAVGAGHTRALVIAPAYFRISDGGTAAGVNVSAFNDVRGTQRGLAIGIFNYARTLDGVQLGVLNYAGNKPRGSRLLPVANFARAR